MRTAGTKLRQKFSNWGEVPVIFDAPMAAALLGESIRTIQYKAQNGIIPAFKVGSQWRFKKEEIQKLGAWDECSEN